MKSILIAITAILSLSVHAQTTENMHGETLRLEWPDAEGWKVADNQENSEMKIIELVRNNETVDNWSEMGTMLVYPLQGGVPVDAAMNAMYEQAKKSCTEAKLTFLEKDEHAAHPWIIFKIECASGPESQVWQIIEGDHNLFVNFRAVKQNTVPDSLKTKWVAFFKTASIVVL